MHPDQARTLMQSWVAGPALRAHMEAVAACMTAYAAKLEPGEADRWTVCGLLHDFDYEKHPTRAEHPFIGVGHLESIGVDEEVRTAILGHAGYSGTPRTSPMAKALFAVDELAGFIVACAKVRPDGIASLEPRSVKKRLKDKGFAAAVSRADISTGIVELAPLFSSPADTFEPVHIQTCIDAIRGNGNLLGWRSGLG